MNPGHPKSYCSVTHLSFLISNWITPYFNRVNLYSAILALLTIVKHWSLSRLKSEFESSTILHFKWCIFWSHFRMYICLCNVGLGVKLLSINTCHLQKSLCARFTKLKRQKVKWVCILMLSLGGRNYWILSFPNYKKIPPHR